MTELFDISRRIFVSGHRGLVGSAIVRRLQRDGAKNLLLRTHAELDLTDQTQVERFFGEFKPDYVFLAAAKVGGIHANSSYPADFLRDNLAIQTNVIHSAWKSGARKLLFLGSSCIYPKLAPQPLQENALLTGPLEPTNEWYAIAKIAGIKQCQAYRRQYSFDAISVMPTNLYGPHDNYDLENSHVVPALIRRLYEAAVRGDSSVTLWGTGSPLREFLHVDDLADALILLMQNYSEETIINAGSGEELNIAALATLVAQIVGFRGELVFDSTKPDGTPRKLLNSSRLKALGWHPRIALKEGLEQAWREWLAASDAQMRQATPASE